MGLFWILLISSILLLITYFFIQNKKSKKYFESRGIDYLGNTNYTLITSMYKGLTMADNTHQMYKEMRSRNRPLGGAIDMGRTIFMIADVEMIKRICVKDFNHFVNRRMFPVLKNDHLIQRMLSIQIGDEWKALRSKMSPAFTTGKIRRMLKIFDSSGKKLVNFVEKEMAKSDSGEIDLTLGYSKFAMDVVASAACGIESKAFDQTDASLFEQMGAKIQFNFGGFNLIKLLTMATLPMFADALGLSFFGLDVQNFFSGVIKGAINYRKEKGEKREDFIQLLLEAREGKLKVEESELDTFEKDAMISDNDKVEGPNVAELLDDDGVVANCVSFIIGGFDTTKTLLIFSAYALAIHPEVQDKLRHEIEDVLDESDGEFTYETVAKMQYLDMFINETLRFYPPLFVTDRTCTQNCQVPDMGFTFKKGDEIGIPIIGIHHDEAYYPEPEKFIPERFSPENRVKLNPYAFIPFGHGPRNCIGMRFALMEVKLAIGHLVKNFNIEPSGKTLIPMKYANAAFLKPVGGMWLALHKR